MSQVKRKKKRLIWSILKVAIITIIALSMLGGVALAGVMLAMVKTSPELDLNGILNLNEPSVLLDDKGQVMDEAPTLEKREIISLDEIPDNLKNAFISIEDERFRKHHGIDPQGIAGAIIADARKFVTGKGGLHGASTITQQLLKNTLLTNETSLRRKVQEMYLAIQLEKTLTKDQILEAYLNTINLGGNVHGVQKAARHYFNKDVKDLSLIECAYIAGVTQNPYYYYAYSPDRLKDPTPYIERTETVLGQMLKNNYIDKPTHDKAISDLNSKKLVFQKPKTVEQANKLNYEWFSRPVLDAVKADLKAQYKYSDEEVENLFMYGGLKIYTTMDRQLQDAAQKIMNEDKTLVRYQSANATATEAVQPQGSAVVMDYHTGEVKTIIGGRGNQPASSYNRAASSNFPRPTGSAIKPITVYAAAIDTWQATAGTVIEDSPLSPEIGKQWPNPDGTPYDPKNDHKDEFRGYVTLREALRRSINLFAVKLEYQIGLKTGVSYADKFGIEYKGEIERNSLSSLALGQFEGTTPLKMAAAYGTFGNNGIYTEPVYYTKVVDKLGKVLLETKPVTRKILSPQSAYVMYDLLKGPTSSEDGATGPSARFGKMPVAGKTGTSSENRNLWFCGLTPYYSGAVWLGDDDNTKPKGLSSNTAAGIWGKIMAAAHKDLEVKDIEMPQGLTKALVCKDSGKAPTDLCYKDPRGSRVYEELFIEGTVPTTLCDVHVEAKVVKGNDGTWKLATSSTPQNKIVSRVFIKRDSIPNVKLYDEQYVLPTEYDTSTSSKSEKEENKNNSVTDIIGNIFNNKH